MKLLSILNENKLPSKEGRFQKLIIKCNLELFLNKELD